MADLPRIFAQPSIPFSGVPQTTPQQFGAGVWHTLAQVTEAMKEKQVPIDAAAQAAQYDIAMEDLKNQQQATDDPNQWRDNFIREEAFKRKEIIDQIADPRQRAVFELHVQRNLAQHVIDISTKGIKASHAKQLGDIETVGNTLAVQSANTDDEALQNSYFNTFRALVTSAQQPVVVGGRPVPGALTPKQSEQMMQKFRIQTLEAYATKVIRGNPEAILMNDQVKSRLGPLGDARILELQNKARIVIEQDETRNDRVMNKNKRMVIDAAEAQANFGKLNQDWLKDALAGNNPLVRPSEARHLQSVNEGTESGTGGPADIIWDEYTSGPRTIGRIQKYREQLNQLSKQLGGPNKYILKYKNELQSDQTTIENQGIARENNAIQRDNRAIRNMQTTYEAYVETNPFLKRIMGNMAPRDKARIEDTYRRQGANEAEKLLNSLIRSGQDKQKNIDQKHGNVLNYDGG